MGLYYTDISINGVMLAEYQILSSTRIFCTLRVLIIATPASYETNRSRIGGLGKLYELRMPTP